MRVPWRRLGKSGCRALGQPSSRRSEEELELCEAPVLAKLKGSLDPDRAILPLAEKTRASTLKRYVTVCSRWRLWLTSPVGEPCRRAS